MSQFTNYEHRVAVYLLYEGTVTRLEHEALDMSLDQFLDVISRMVYRKLIATRQIEWQKRGSAPRIINEYSLTKEGAHLYRNLI